MPRPPHRNQRGYLVALAILAAALMVWGWLHQGGDDALSPQLTRPARGLTAVFIDVGQGDSTLLLCGDDAVLIDAGPDAAPVLEALSAYAVEELTAVIATHPHADHIGGLAMILDTVPVKALYMPQAVTTTETFNRVMRAVEKNLIDLYAPEVGQQLLLGDATLTFLHPPKGPWGNERDLNNASIVVRVVSQYGSLLLTGDAETEAERDVLETGLAVRSDGLKVGHHGSDSSTTDDFLAAVGPRFAVISCGAGNTYGHPHAATLGKLADAGVTVYRTDVNGTVTVIFTDTGIAVTTEK